ncbi:hypothetical protein Cgig2_011155 [Carnegiea gigantea]|uniref:Uncharacterized protein n=1 Tax=Carnegiea gigantea TaxID=171969 RepID=A0A9Q1GMP1_9CARY|nr:hypothetical protein Cgig2_011155 [Carnegiea gigantea]
MNVPYGGSSTQGNVVPTLNLLSNSNPNDQSLRQESSSSYMSTIATVGYYPSFYFDPRTTGGLTSMMYIMKKWRKGIKVIQSNELIIEDGMKDTAVCPLVWRMQMDRKINVLLTTNQMNREARLLCEEYFSKLKELIEVEVGSAYLEDNVQQDDPMSAKSILNPPATNLESRKTTKVIPENVIEFAPFPMNMPLYGLRGSLSKDPSGSLLLQNGLPLCMNIPYGGSSTQGNVVPTLNLLSNSNPNDQSLRQSTIAIVGYYPPFYFDPRTAEGLTPLMYQSFISQTPINGACNQCYNNGV